MALEEMLVALEQESQNDIRKIDSEAEAYENQIILEAEEEAKKTHEISMKNADEEVRLEKARIISRANFQVKKEIVRVKEEMVNKVFDEIVNRAKTLRNQSSYESVFEKLASEALSGIPGNAVVSVDLADETLARKTFEKMGVDCTIKTDFKCSGGLKVMSEDGNIVLNNSIDSRIDKAKQFLMTDIIKVLFGDN